MKRFILGLCCLVFLLFAVSCDTADNGGTEASSSTADELLVIVDGSQTDYVIVRSDIKDVFKKPALDLMHRLEDITGCDFPIETDWKDTPVVPHEIIVGYTNREGTEYAELDRTGIDDEGYIIRVEGERLLIIGNTEAGTQNGVDYFMEQYVTENGIAVPRDLNIVVKQEYQVKSLTVAGHDIAEYVIVCDQSAGAPVRTAANALQSYIKAACGKVPEIVSASDGKPAIMLDTEAFDDDESYSIKTTENGVVIGGSPVRGVLYGAYRFLEEYIGWRFLAADTEVLKAAETVNVDAIDETYTPYFEYRDTYWTNHFDSAFSAKRAVNSSNSRHSVPELGGLIGYTGQFVHTFTPLIGTDPYQQPCLSDPKTYEDTLAAVMKILEENPDSRIISVSQNDNQNSCQCAQCLATDTEEGSPAGTLLRFVNRIAEAVEKDYPKVAIHTLAYQYTREAPKITVPRDNVIVQLCTIECCFNHALDDDTCETNRALKEDMIAWSNICNRIYVWDYTTNFMYYIAPFPNFDVIAANVRFFHEHNVKGLFEQGNYQSGGNAELGDLRAYLLSKLMYNPYMEEEEYERHINEFLQGYYGAGWENIRKYYDFIMETSNKKGDFGIYHAPDEMYRFADFRDRCEEIDTWFDAAEAAAEDELRLAHVQHTRLSFTYLKWYFLYDKYVFASEDEATAAKAKEEVAALFDGLAAHNVRPGEPCMPIGEYPVDAVDKTASPKEWRVPRLS